MRCAWPRSRSICGRTTSPGDRKRGAEAWAQQGATRLAPCKDDYNRLKDRWTGCGKPVDDLVERAVNLLCKIGGTACEQAVVSQLEITNYFGLLRRCFFAIACSFPQSLGAIPCLSNSANCTAASPGLLIFGLTGLLLDEPNHEVFCGPTSVPPPL